MLRIAFLLLLMVCGAAVAANPAIPHSGKYAPAIAHLRSFVPEAMARHHTLGAAVAVVDGNRVLWSQGFGFAERAKLHAVTPSSVFSLQSISKTYTALLFLKGVDKGWFHLDDRLIDQLPSFRVHSRFDDKDYEKITFRQMLSHWSGLSHEAPVGNNYDDGDNTFEEHVASITDTWLLAPPGSRYAYSNLGFDLAAYILEKRSGERFAKWADAELFSPLHMTASTYDRDRAIANTNFVHGQQDGKDVPVFIPMLGAGGLYSSVDDMAKFVIFENSEATTREGHALLSARSLREMRTPQFPVDHQVAGYGLGIFSRPTYGAIMYSHGGGGYGYDAEQRWIPKHRFGVAVLTNDGDGGLAEEIADEVTKTVLKAKLGNLLADEPFQLTDRSVIAPTTEEMKSVQGTYRAYSGLRTFAIESGGLHYKVGTLDLPLRYHGHGEYTADNERFRFHFDDRGRAIWAEDLGTIGVDTFVANELTDDPPGTTKPEWMPYLGDYEGFSYGALVPSQIFLRNGYLFTSRGGGTKLIEYKPGFFFSVWGETVVFAGDAMFNGSRRFTRKIGDSRSITHPSP